MNTGSCIQTIELLRRLALNVHGVIDAVDDRNCDEIISLLKEQEPVKPIRLENWWECPSCSGNIVANMKYCPGCGRSVEWDA